MVHASMSEGPHWSDIAHWMRPRHPAAAGAAATLALHPPPLVSEEVPVLRLQLARVERHFGARTTPARAGLPGRAACRSAGGAAADLGPPGAHRLHRGRHAQPVFARGDRPPARGCAGAAQARRRRRDHAGSESRHVRERPFQGFSCRGRDALVDWRAELSRHPPQGPGPGARQCAGAGCSGGGPRWPSTPSTSTSCTRCQGRR